VEQCAVAVKKVRPAGFSGEGFVRAVADDDDGWLDEIEMLQQVLKPFVGGAEVPPGAAGDRVARPAEIPERHVGVRVGQRQSKLDVAIALLPFKKCIADKSNDVAVSQGERLGGWCGTGCDETRQNNDKRACSKHGISGKNSCLDHTATRRRVKRTARST